MKNTSEVLRLVLQFLQYLAIKCLDNLEEHLTTAWCRNQKEACHLNGILIWVLRAVLRCTELCSRTELRSCVYCFELPIVFCDVKKEDGVYGTAAWHRVCCLICVLQQLAWI